MINIVYYVSLYVVQCVKLTCVKTPAAVLDDIHGMIDRGLCHTVAPKEAV
jgi:hypothetical protein